MIFVPVALAIVTFGGLAANSLRKPKPLPKKTMTPQRAEVLKRTLNTNNLAPEKIREVAAAFGREGFKEEEKLLNKRASLRELSPETKAARKEIYKKALASKDRDQVLKIAKAFEDEGAVGAADTLRKYAAGLE